jgi:hypothetical protein
MQDKQNDKQTMTEEESSAWASQRLGEVGYGLVPPDERRRITHIFLGEFRKKRTRSLLYPTIAIMECYLADRGIGGKRIARASILLAHWLLRRKAASLGDIPGINDWLMIRWFWTHDPSYLEQLIVRSHRNDMVGESCRWMLNSVRLRHPLIDARLLQEEKENSYGA